jgi:hypothetical protein
MRDEGTKIRNVTLEDFGVNMKEMKDKRERRD